MSLKNVLLLGLLCLSFAAGATVDPQFDDATGQAKDSQVSEIEYFLAQMKVRGLTMFVGIYSEIAVDSIVEEALKDKVRGGYQIAIGIAKNHNVNGYTYLAISADSLKNSNIFLELDARLSAEMSLVCDGCEKLAGDDAAEVIVSSLRRLNQQAGHAGQPGNDFEIYPYLPLTAALETRIEQYAGMIERMVPLWEEVRIVHTTEAKATSIPYDTYMTKMKTFVDSMRAVTELIEQDITEQATITSMYPTQQIRINKSQRVNLIANGHDFVGSLRHDRALTVLRRELNTGKIPQMLDEVAALEYFFAYHYLPKIYAFAGKEGLLDLVLDKQLKTGNKYTYQGFNQYDLYTLSTYNVSVSAPLLFASIGTTSGHELMKIHYKNSRTNMSWKMYCACKTQSVDFGVGLSTDFLMPVNVAARITPSADGLNHANTAAIQFYPPNFFRSPLYEFGNVSVGGDMAVNEISYTLAGSAKYTAGGRVLGLETSGLNFGVGASNSVGVSADATAGAGRCVGWGVHEFKGLPKNLTNATAPPDPTPEQRIKSATFGAVQNDPSLDQEDLADLEQIMIDVDSFARNFPGKQMKIRVYGYSAGYFYQITHPEDYTGSISSLSQIEDKMAVENYRTAKLLAQNIENTLVSQLASRGIRADAYTIELKDPLFFDPDTFEYTIQELQGFKRDYKWSRHPKSWRLGMVTMHASE